MASIDKTQRVESRDQLVAYFEAGNKPASAFRIGTEHEKFGYIVDGQRPLPYDGPQGVRAMLEGMQRFGWQPVFEGDNVIALQMDGASITLEPGGQFELSGAPLETVHQTCDEVHTHLKQVREVADEIGVGFLGMGFSPTWTFDETPIMPKGRYKIMRAYMPKVGNLGQDMMFRSATVQTNLDFSSEADMVRKFRVSLALQPVATALFANSPFTEGKPNGFLSFRSQIWTDTDPDRTGMLPFVFEDGFGFDRYADYALDVPMYFVNRGGDYIDVSGQSFRDFIKGELPGLKGEVPTLNDWESHLTTIFPEVRLKHFLEMRGADGGPWARLCALPALFVGLLYSTSALNEAEALIADWTDKERLAMRNAVPVHGLKTPFRDGTLQDIAREMMGIARRGLIDRAKQDGLGGDETSFLTTLDNIVASGKTPAEVLLDKYHNEWKGDLSRLFIEESY